MYVVRLCGSIQDRTAIFTMRELVSIKIMLQHCNFLKIMESRKKILPQLPSENFLLCANDRTHYNAVAGYPSDRL